MENTKQKILSMSISVFEQLASTQKYLNDLIEILENEELPEGKHCSIKYCIPNPIECHNGARCDETGDQYISFKSFTKRYKIASRTSLSWYLKKYRVPYFRFRNEIFFDDHMMITSIMLYKPKAVINQLLKMKDIVPALNKAYKRAALELGCPITQN